MEKETIICDKCKKAMDPINFYTYRSGEKTELCKKCLTMHIDIFDPSTYIWLLEKMDVPYIEVEWNTLRDAAYAKNPLKINAMSVFGKYLSKMRLKQWKNYHWEDTERIKAEYEEKIKEKELEAKAKEELLKSQFNNGDINESQYLTFMGTDSLNGGDAPNPLLTNPKNIAAITDAFDQSGVKNGLSPVGNNPFAHYDFLDEVDSPASQLTKEDKIYLAMKWGRSYQPDQWIELEKKYDDMNKSFDIQDSDTEGTLILICKTYLKMNEAINIGDMDGFQKLSRVYDTLRKSAKFTAAQNKQERENFVDSIGELVSFCEKEEGFIPRFCTDVPQDKIDLLIQDHHKYIETLVKEDLGFGQQIDIALKKIQIQNEMEEMEDENFEENTVYEFQDSDYQELMDQVIEDREADFKTIKGEI